MATTLVVTGVIVLCASAAFGTRLAAGPAAPQGEAHASSFKCSNRSLSGNYGFTIEGTILAGTPNAFQLRGVSMTHFDGEGNLSQVDFTTRNGAPMTPDWRSGVGTYEVNPDCTGSALIIQSDGTPSVHLRLVVVERGRQVRTTVIGNASGSVGIRVD